MNLTRDKALAILILSLALTITTSSLTTKGQSSIPAGVVSTPNSSPLLLSVGPNLDIAGEAAPDRQQVETTVSIDPHNSSIIVAGAQDLRLRPLEHRWLGYYRSTDNGQAWTSTLLPGYPGDNSLQGLSSPLHGSNTTSDPVLAFDRQGNLYYAGLVLNISRNVLPSNAIAFVAKYTNNGSTYSNTTLIKGTFSADKEWIAVDNTGGPYDGRVYLALDANPNATANFATMFTRSSDGGKTFSTPYYAPADQTGNLPGMTIDPSGNIYVSSLAFDPVSGIPLNYTQVTKIAAGGASIVQNVRAVNPAYWLTNTFVGGQPLPGAQFRTSTIPQMSSDFNGVYIVFDDVREGNASVFFERSTDGGSTWTTPMRINDTPNGQHFFPTISASLGTITIAWYDSRLNTGPTMTTLDVYLSESTDDGVSFLPNMRVTGNSFNPNTARRTDAPNPISYFMGDYIGISSTGTVAHLVWADNQNVCDTIDPTWGCVDQDAFTSMIQINPSTIGGIIIPIDRLRLVGGPLLAVSLGIAILTGLFALAIYTFRLRRRKSSPDPFLGCNEGLRRTRLRE